MATKTNQWHEINSTEHRCITGNRYLLIVNGRAPTLTWRVCLGHERNVLAEGVCPNSTLAAAKSAALLAYTEART
jgi:hypothetical protein